MVKTKNQMGTAKFLQAGLLTVMGLMVQVSDAQVAVDVSGHEVRITSEKGSSVNLNSDAIGPDVQIEGVAVINGEVFIDGARVPKGKTSFTAKKTGKSYRIQWGKDGNVSVSEK